MSKSKLPQLDDESYFYQLAAQNGGCWICGKRPTTRRLAGDHNHETGKRRGLLCGTCNWRVIGRIEGICKRWHVDVNRIAAYFQEFQ